MIAFKRIMALGLTLALLLPTFVWSFDLATVSVTIPNGHAIIVHGDHLLMPNKWGIVQSSFQGSSKTVVLIQDLHCNYGVQKNILHILNYLHQHYGIQLVAQEGAWGTIDYHVFRDFPDPAIRKTVTDFFMRQGRLTGADYLAANSAKPMITVGLESAPLYRQSLKTVRAFLNSETQGLVMDLRNRLNEVKDGLFRGRLETLEKWAQAYRQGKMDIYTYAAQLQKTARYLGVDTSAFGIANLNSHPTAPAANEELNTALRQLDDRLRAQLYTAEAQKEADQWGRRLDMIEKLVNISATPAEVDEFRRHRDDYRMARCLAFLNRQAPDRTGMMPDEPLALDQALDQVFDFYQMADERSSCFVANLDDWMAKTGRQSAIMITGGFHRRQVEAALEARNISFLSVRPRVSRTNVVNPYFDILQNRPMPVEKLLKKNQTVLATRNSLQKGGNTLRIFALYQAALAKFKHVNLHDYLPDLTALGLRTWQTPAWAQAPAGGISQPPKGYKVFSENTKDAHLIVMVGHRTLAGIQHAPVVFKKVGAYFMGWFENQKSYDQTVRKARQAQTWTWSSIFLQVKAILSGLRVWRQKNREERDKALASLAFSKDDDLNASKFYLGINYNQEAGKLQYALKRQDEPPVSREPENRMVTWETALPSPGRLQRAILGEMRQVRKALGQNLGVQVRIDAAGLLNLPDGIDTAALRSALWHTDTVTFYPNDLPDYASGNEPSTNPFDQCQTAADAARAAGEALYLVAEKAYINPHTDEMYVHPLADNTDYRKEFGLFYFLALRAIARLYIKLNMSLVYINTATFAGGVAIMRHENVRQLRLRYLKELGVDVHWLVIQPKPGTNPYLVTKKFHNNLQGVSEEPLTAEDKLTLLDFNAYNEKRIKAFIKKQAGRNLFIFVDDPQPSPMVYFLRVFRQLPVLWRCHIQLDSGKIDDPGQPNAAYGEFLAKLVRTANLMVFQEKEGIPKVFEKFKGRMLQMYPARDWFGLNKPRTKPLVRYYLRRFNSILQAQGGQTPLSLERPVILQKARFDPAKAYEDAIHSFYLLQKKLQSQRGPLEEELKMLQSRLCPTWRERRRMAELQRKIDRLNPQLVLEGNIANDDPDVYALYTLCQLKAQGMNHEYYIQAKLLNAFAQRYFGPDFEFSRPLPEEWINWFYDKDLRVRKEMSSMTDSIKIVRMPRDDQLLNSLFFLKKFFHVPMVYLQLSHREGFEFNIMEALHQGITAIVRNVGGMPAQVRNGRTGFIVDDQENAEAFARKVVEKMDYLLYGAKWWKKIGMSWAARRFARTHYHTGNLSIKYLLLGILTYLGARNPKWLERFITRLETKAGGERQATDELLEVFIFFWLSLKFREFAKGGLDASLDKIRKALTGWSEQKSEFWDVLWRHLKAILGYVFQLARQLAVESFPRIVLIAFLMFPSDSAKAAALWNSGFADLSWSHGLLALMHSSLLPAALLPAGILVVLWRRLNPPITPPASGDTITVAVRDFPGVKHALEHPQESYGQNPYAANPIASLLEKAVAGLFEKPEMVLDILIICGPGQRFHVGWKVIQGQKRFVLALPGIYRAFVKPDESPANRGWRRIWQGILRWSMRVQLNAAFKAFGHTPPNFLKREREIKGRRQRFLSPGTAV